MIVGSFVLTLFAVAGLVKSCWCENVTRFLNYTELQAYTDQSNKEVDKNRQTVIDVFNKWTFYPIDEGLSFVSLL